MRAALAPFALACLLLGLLAGCESRGSLEPCESDADCPAGEGCDTEYGSNSDAYCTPLCAFDSECPHQLLCGERGTDGQQCAGVGEHRDGKGVCDQFDGSNGPNSCEDP